MSSCLFDSFSWKQIAYAPTEFSVKERKTKLLCTHHRLYRTFQLSLTIPPWVGAMSTKKGGNALRLESKGRYGWWVVVSLVVVAAAVGHLYSALLWDEPIPRDAQIWPVIARGSHSFTATHSRTITAFTPQPYGITALWLVLIAPTHGGMARLSW